MLVVIHAEVAHKLGVFPESRVTEMIVSVSCPGIHFPFDIAQAEGYADHWACK